MTYYFILHEISIAYLSDLYKMKTSAVKKGTELLSKLIANRPKLGKGTQKLAKA
jgi:hypothetical protein